MNKPLNPWMIAMAILMILLTVGSAVAFSTLSLSKVDLVSNDATVGGPAWLLTVVENGNDQHAEGTFTPDQLKDTDGSTAKNSIKIEIDNTKNVCQYSFQNQYTSILQMELRDAPSSLLSPSWYNTAAKCEAIPGSVLAYVFNANGYCLISTTTGKVTPLSTPATEVTSTVKATVNSETVSGVVTNTGQRSVNLGTRAYASWEGNLVSGQQCPAPLDSGVMGAQVNGQFYITNKQAYDRYDPQYRDLQACIAGAYANTIVSYDQVVGCVNAYNGRALAAIQKTAIAPFSTATVSNGQATITLPNLLQYPVITMRVRADWIGIVVPVGKPEIVSVTSTAFTEASPGTIRAVVKNVGTGQGSFVVSAQCTAPTAQAGIAQSIKLAPGASGFVDIPVTGQASGSTKTATCTVTAQDINQPTSKDTETVTVTVNPIALCEPTVTRCLQNTIQQCNQQGTQWIDSQTCLNGCTSQNGQPTCQNAELCDTDAQCDDNDPTTVDACVGVVSKTCQHKVIPPKTDDSFDFGKYGMLILWISLAVIFGVGATILGKTQGAGWYALHIVTVIAAGGAIFAFFALFSTFAAVMLAIGMILVLAGIALFAVGLAPYGIAGVAFGAIFVIIALVATFATLPTWMGWFT